MLQFELMMQQQMQQQFKLMQQELMQQLEKKEPIRSSGSDADEECDDVVENRKRRR